MFLNDDVIFIADSHTQKNRDALIYKLNNLEKIRNIPSQIVFLGDIANLFVGGIKNSIKENENLIQCINNLKSQIIYFEGNHDFDLKEIFDTQKVKIIDRKMQPLLATYKNKKILLAHGDIFLDKKYEFYINTISSKKILTFLNNLDSISGGKIFDFFKKRIHTKTIKYPDGIDSIINTRILKYKSYIKSLNTKIDIVIEGHFHIGKIINDDFVYVAMPSFYYESKIFNMKEFEII